MSRRTHHHNIKTVYRTVAPPSHAKAFESEADARAFFGPLSRRHLAAFGAMPTVSIAFKRPVGTWVRLDMGGDPFEPAADMLTAFELGRHQWRIRWVETWRGHRYVGERTVHSVFQACKQLWLLGVTDRANRDVDVKVQRVDRRWIGDWREVDACALAERVGL